MSKVYMLVTHEEDRAETRDMFLPIVYATREIAEISAKQYNAKYNDPAPATVAELEVRETPSPIAYGAATA
jgi:hypothetical protein